jgi:hypothetical protein
VVSNGELRPAEGVAAMLALPFMLAGSGRGPGPSPRLVVSVIPFRDERLVRSGMILITDAPTAWVVWLRSVTELMAQKESRDAWCKFHIIYNLSAGLPKNGQLSCLLLYKEPKSRVLSESRVWAQLSGQRFSDKSCPIVCVYDNM